MDSHIPEDALVSPPLHTTQDIPTTTDPEEADAQAAAIDVPDDTGEGGKLRMIVQLVKRSFGVKDLAAMWATFSLSVECPLARVTRTALFSITHLTLFLFLCRRLSLPASLLEPIPNLEYWHYLDRPDLFVSYVSLSLPPPTVLCPVYNDW